MPDIPDKPADAKPSRRIAGLLFVLSFFAAALTLPGFGITWDEPGYVDQAKRIGAWFRLLVWSPTTAVRDSTIQKYWPVWESNQPRQPGNEAIQDRLNPPLALELGEVTGAMFRGILGEFAAYRLLGALCFAGLVSLLFLWMARSLGQLPGLFAALSFATLPRIFGHAHIFATDVPATFMMLITAYALTAHPASRAWKLAGGIFLGLAAATKFTALILPVPIFIWAAVRKDRRTMFYTIIAVIIGFLVMIKVNPGLWHHTFDRLALFIQLSSVRSRFIAIPTYYFGKVYWFKLPWHHPWVMIFGTIPITIAALSLLGIGRVFSRREKSPDAMLHAIVFVVLMATFMAPGAPGHDGERLFLPAFPFVAALAGYGFKWIIDKVNGERARAVFFAAVIAPGLIGIVMWHPYELSYYGLAVGGGRGAHWMGLESTYWADSLTPKNEANVRKVTEGNARSFAPYFEQPLFWRAQTGRLGAGAYIAADNPRWALLIGRQGMMDDATRLAYEWGSPWWEARRNGVRLAALFDVSRMYNDVGERLKTLDIDEPRTWYLKGLLAEATGAFSEAMSCYDRALTMKPVFERAYLHKGRVLRALGRSREALDVFNALIKNRPAAEYFMELARTFTAMRDTQNALDTYKKVLSIHLNYPGAVEEALKLSKPLNP